jgi:hypothetical protein
MDKLESTARVGNSDLVRCIGISLRQAMQDIAREELPESMRHLLSKLEGVEPAVKAKGRPTHQDPAA